MVSNVHEQCGFFICTRFTAGSAGTPRLSRMGIVENLIGSCERLENVRLIESPLRHRCESKLSYPLHLGSNLELYVFALPSFQTGRTSHRCLCVPLPGGEKGLVSAGSDRLTRLYAILPHGRVVLVIIGGYLPMNPMRWVLTSEP